MSPQVDVVVGIVWKLVEVRLILGGTEGNVTLGGSVGKPDAVSGMGLGYAPREG